MKTGLTIVAGLLVGILVAVGILAAFVFVGPDPVGLRPTPAPTLIPPTPAPSPTASVGPSASAGSASPVASGSPGPSGSPGASSPPGSADPGAAFRVGQPAPALVAPQLGGGTIDLASLRGKPVWLTFLQSTCSDCVAAVPLMNGFSTRYADDGLVVIAIDVRETESVVTAFVQERKASFPVGLDTDGAVQQAWRTLTLPSHVWIGADGIVRDAAIGAINGDRMATAVRTILPGVTVTP